MPGLIASGPRIRVTEDIGHAIKLIGHCRENIMNTGLSYGC